jgi:hypothetical protein
MCSPPLGEGAKPATKREKIKGIILLSIPCNLFAPRDTPDLHTKRTRNTSVIYSTKEEQAKKENKEKQVSQPCILKYTQRDPPPYASPEGPGTHPSAKCQRWSAARPLGAAMRLTASRQPYDISRQKNCKPPKTILDHDNGSFTPHFLNCKPTTANTDQGENTRPRSAP